MGRKWGYAHHARKARYCEECGRRLNKEEVVICTTCFEELLATLMWPTVEVDDNDEQVGRDEDETEDE
jgi:hypothetical protein